MPYTKIIKQSLLILLAHWSVGCLKGTSNTEPREGSSLNGAVSAATFASELRAQYRSCPVADRSRTAERLCQRRAISSSLNKLMPVPNLPTIQSPVFSRALLKPSVVVVNQRRRVVTEACPNLGELAADFAAECQAIVSKKITDATLQMLYLMANIQESDVEGLPPQKVSLAAQLLEGHLLSYAIEAYNNSPDLWEGQKDDIEITNWTEKTECVKYLGSGPTNAKKYAQNYKFPIYLMSEDFLKKRAFNIYKYAKSLGKSNDCKLRSIGQALCLDPEPLYEEYTGEILLGGIRVSDTSKLLNDLLRWENPSHQKFPFIFPNNDRPIRRVQIPGRYTASDLLLLSGGPGTYIASLSDLLTNKGHAVVVIVTKDGRIFTQDFQSYVQHEGLPLPGIVGRGGRVIPTDPGHQIPFMDHTTGESRDPNVDGDYYFMKVTNTPLPLDDKATLLVNYIDKLKNASN